MKSLLRIGLLSAVPLALLASARLADAAEASPRPNILFLLTDDQRDNTLSAMGHPSVKTPNLDALMRNSVRFTNASIATPV